MRHMKLGDTQVRLIKVLSFFIYVNVQLTQLVDSWWMEVDSAKRGAK